ncbi:MAG: RNA recognition motif domain-containing protein [Rhabdochlamydiaceae bacterium]
MSEASNKKLYVGSLPYSVTEEELRNLFAEFGEVSSVRIITDKFTGQSKGFGFVEMESSEDAEKAIEGMNGKALGHRTLIVNDARPEQKRERSFSGERPSRGERSWGNDDHRGGGRRFRRDH